MKLFLTKDFNKEFFNDGDLICRIVSYVYVSDVNSFLSSKYNNDALYDTTFEDLTKCDIWNIDSPEKLAYEPTLEYNTVSGYGFYTYRLRIDPSIPAIKKNINKKLRCIGLLDADNILYGILYFNGEDDVIRNETSEGVSISNFISEINLSLTFDEKSDSGNVTLNDTDDIIKNSHLETPDLVRYTAEKLILKVTNTNDNTHLNALSVADDQYLFNTTNIPLIIRRYKFTKPFMSLSNEDNSMFINTSDNAFKVYVPKNCGESYNIFSNNITTAVGSIDVNSNNIEHTNDLSDRFTDITYNSNNVSLTVTGYINAELNTLINVNGSRIIGDNLTLVNVSGVSENATDFALGDGAFINSIGLSSDNGADTRSEMNFTTIGSLDSISYNKADYDWTESDNSILMLGSNVSSVNINGNNDTFIGFSGLASNNKPDSYLIGSYNNPFDASLLTISTGWYKPQYQPKLFKLERDFVYATDASWINRNNLMNVFDDKDIEYTYYEDGHSSSGTIEDATCIQLGKTYLTTNELVYNYRKADYETLISLKNNTTDMFYGQSLDSDLVGEIENIQSSINAFAVHLSPKDFTGSSPVMSLTDLIEKIEDNNKLTFTSGIIYTIYIIMENDAGNTRFIDDGTTRKCINNGDVVTCTVFSVLNSKIL